MDTTELGVLFGGISSILAVLIYFTKNIKESSCCGSKCKQVVVDSTGRAICPKQSIISIPDPTDTFPQSINI